VVATGSPSRVGTPRGHAVPRDSGGIGAMLPGGRARAASRRPPPAGPAGRSPRRSRRPFPSRRPPRRWCAGMPPARPGSTGGPPPARGPAPGHLRAGVPHRVRVVREGRGVEHHVGAGVDRLVQPAHQLGLASVCRRSASRP
jgi:hypothetical protein